MKILRTIAIILLVVFGMWAILWVNTKDKPQSIHCLLHQGQLVNGVGQLTVTFRVDEPRIDSVQATQIAFATACSSGSAEENASWRKDMTFQAQKWTLVKGDSSYSISGTIDNCENFDDCEMPPEITITARIYRKGNGSRDIALWAHPNEIVRK